MTAYLAKTAGPARSSKREEGIPLDGIGGARRPRRAQPPTARGAAAVIAIAAMALLVAACGGSPGGRVAQLGSTTTLSSSSSNPPAPSAQVNGALAFSDCMRSRGVPNFPDPNSSGEFPKATLAQLAASNSRFQTAQRACQHLLPNGGSAPAAAEIARVRAQALRFSQCVRKHGVTNFPDPGGDGRIPDPGSFGIDQGSPQFQAANHACAKYRPPYMPSNAAYDAWARTHPS